MKKIRDRYKNHAPIWMMITRDILGALGVPFTLYLQSFPIPDNIDNIISATILFLVPAFTILCAILTRDYNKNEDPINPPQ